MKHANALAVGEMTPSHGRTLEPTGAQMIDVIERLTFNLGTAIECIMRAGNRPGADIIADLQRAQWHLNREVNRVKDDEPKQLSSSVPSGGDEGIVVDQLGRTQQNGTVWLDRMGDKYRFCNGGWQYQTVGQTSWEPVRFPRILTDFGPYTPMVDCDR